MTVCYNNYGLKVTGPYQKAHPPKGKRFRGMLVNFRADRAPGWLPPVFSVQPFADEVGNYSCHDRGQKSDHMVHTIASFRRRRR